MFLLTDQILNENCTKPLLPWKAHSKNLLTLFDMKDFFAEYFWRVARLMGAFRQMLTAQTSQPHGPEFLTDYWEVAWKPTLLELQKICEEIGLNLSVAGIERMMQQSGRYVRDHASLSSALAELEERIEDELKNIKFLYLMRSNAEHYTYPRKGWEEIIERFPDTVSDIEEARKCFALDRYTAAVFHSLQVIEIGTIELGKFMQVGDPMPGWAATTNELQKILRKNYKDRSDFEKAHSPFFEQMYGTVEALKNAWRNKVSHAQGKLILMRGDFNPDIAEEILFATRAFMRRLVEGLPPLHQE